MTDDTPTTGTWSFVLRHRGGRALLNTNRRLCWAAKARCKADAERIAVRAASERHRIPKSEITAAGGPDSWEAEAIDARDRPEQAGDKRAL